MMFGWETDDIVVGRRVLSKNNLTEEYMIGQIVAIVSVHVVDNVQYPANLCLVNLRNGGIFDSNLDKFEMAKLLNQDGMIPIEFRKK